MPDVKYNFLSLLLIIYFLLPGQPENLWAENQYTQNNHPTKRSISKALQALQHDIGSNDAVLVANRQGRIIFSKNAEKPLIPASTLKILTSLVALHYLGPDYRFTTEFYMDAKANLKIKGYGDPLLISEILAKISKSLSADLSIKGQRINDLVLDDSYFIKKIVIPGKTESLEPYDAPNGALCVNFNTVYFKQLKDGSFISAEPQTPLLPIAFKRIKQSGLKKERIVLTHAENEITLYAGHLFQYLLNKEGIKTKGKIKLGTVRKDKNKLIYRYASEFTLKQIISRLLEHSNNFMANQILIATGAKVFGPPGTLGKGILAASTYAKNVLNIDNIRLVEGSGMSRRNRISAKNLAKIIKEFEPYYNLMRHLKGEYYKSGTLKGITTRTGYIENKKGELYRFVVMLNSPGKSMQNIMDSIHQLVE
ncbi:MAG: D-alanyl-D-alanine carboxypeptidase [Desulfobacterales bacterium]|uniref:D-alanyl-D-alanine carboxypeptidase n=1 Tax=Candidatus Desulfaltia bathyphila TaxID=2841697 RepID=A0A8J6N2J4_9BACT|nr:D-alanyl-D-alanine carboxypeptidase [Candidatus Desulfaltia bathyphila]MBL7194710.1 D-alanyl-D-alanine carboxypeptidase [Desulfobacterales bacterium]MBL7207322.1 D-alanyl-D-alanine carboxypeptidase [Desulfobacterales bacterium]